MRIEPLVPERTPRRAGRWRDHRQVIDAIAWKYRTGSPWADLPEEFGSWKASTSGRGRGCPGNRLTITTENFSGRSPSP
jgi:transposase